MAHSAIKGTETRMTALTFFWPVPTVTVTVVSDMPPRRSGTMPVRKAVFEISSISTSSGTQTRAGISEATVAEYAEAMISGDRFPPCFIIRCLYSGPILRFRQLRTIAIQSSPTRTQPG